MSLLIRSVALLLAASVIIAPVQLALLVASMEPSRPLQVSWVVPFALGGLLSASGYLLVAFAPKRLAAASHDLRLLGGCLLALPFGIAIYLLSVTHSVALVAVCLFVVTGTALLFTASVWPSWLNLSNPSLQRTASGGR